MCCGEKRKKLLETMKHKEQNNKIETTESVADTDRSDRLFEYVGDTSLKVTGAVTGNAYNFRFKGDRVEVDYFDAFGLMGERELRLLNQN